MYISFGQTNTGYSPFQNGCLKWQIANGVTSYIALASHYTVIGFGARVV